MLVCKNVNKHKEAFLMARTRGVLCRDRPSLSRQMQSDLAVGKWLLRVFD